MGHEKWFEWARVCLCLGADLLPNPNPLRPARAQVQRRSQMHSGARIGAGWPETTSGRQINWASRGWPLWFGAPLRNVSQADWPVWAVWLESNESSCVYFGLVGGGWPTVCASTLAPPICNSAARELHSRFGGQLAVGAAWPSRLPLASMRGSKEVEPGRPGGRLGGRWLIGWPAASTKADPSRRCLNAGTIETSRSPLQPAPP